MYGKKSAFVRARLRQSVGRNEVEEVGEDLWGAAVVFSSPSTSTPLVFTLSPPTAASSTSSSPGARRYCNTSLGKTAKNASSITPGRKLNPPNAPLTLHLHPVITKLYIPAPTKPAAPVPLPQLASAYCP